MQCIRRMGSLDWMMFFGRLDWIGEFLMAWTVYLAGSYYYSSVLRWWWALIRRGTAMWFIGTFMIPLSLPFLVFNIQAGALRVLARRECGDTICCLIGCWNYVLWICFMMFSTCFLISIFFVGWSFLYPFSNSPSECFLLSSIPSLQIENEMFVIWLSTFNAYLFISDSLDLMEVEWVWESKVFRGVVASNSGDRDWVTKVMV